MKHWTGKLVKLNACEKAVVWAKDYDSLDKAWQKCQRGDWMLWLIGKTITNDANKKLLVLVACECARLALPYVSKGESRSLKAIETTEAWARGEATIEEVRTAADAAHAVAYAAWAAADAARAAEVEWQRRHLDELMNKLFEAKL